MKSEQSHRHKIKLKKGDEVIVLTGKAKQSKGKIESIDYQNKQAVIGGINLYKRHQKPDKANPDGGIIEKPMPIHISNLAIVDPKTSKATRVGLKIKEDGSKVRIAKSSQTELS